MEIVAVDGPHRRDRIDRAQPNTALVLAQNHVAGQHRADSGLHADRLARAKTGVEEQRKRNIYIAYISISNKYVSKLQKTTYMYTIMKPLLEQIKKRRIDQNLKQKDMMLRIDISRQQYQQIESRGNPRLETLELIAKGLNSELMLIPKEKLREVQYVLQHDTFDLVNESVRRSREEENRSLSDDPWQDLLGDDQ